MKNNCLLVFSRKSVSLIPIIAGGRWIVGQRRQQCVILVRVLRTVVAGGVYGQPQHGRSLGLGWQSWSCGWSFDIHFVRLCRWSVIDSGGLGVHRWHNIIILLLNYYYHLTCYAMARAVGKHDFCLHKTGKNVKFI